MELPVQPCQTFIFDLAPTPAPASVLPLAPTAEEEGEEQWTQVGSRYTISPLAGLLEKRRRGPRRPLGSTKALKGTKDIREVFNKLYE